ncbi:hypothetical protein RFI_08932 [Reticulomyxa filosa]|uniref:EF-hand domain-containing protein n=1 Tax=Reticulomyxa filosa TaxID=46433 RepID=X6NQK3_RETFI|nr:hypothetical protein RFI_08932 [Reticulomyxa filosa]|eukprot:ETO28198.1 hypothetical protein RFI_08932 [Reticulomyxa filosa]
MKSLEKASMRMSNLIIFTGIGGKFCFCIFFFTCQVQMGTIRQIQTQSMDTGNEITVLTIQCNVGAQRYWGNRGGELPLDLAIYSPSHYPLFAPPGSQVTKYHPKLPKWRKELNQGSQCDCLDSVHKWYTCHVIATDEISDAVRVNYDDWGDKYDEWISREAKTKQEENDQRITIICVGGVYGLTDDLDPTVDDEDDPVDENTFAIYRVLLYLYYLFLKYGVGDLGHTSFHLIAVLNEFGRAGGFDLLIRRLNNHKPCMPVKNIRFILSTLSKSVNALTRQTYQKYILPLHQHVCGALESMSDVELRELKKEFMTKIVEAMEDLLRRGKSPIEIAQFSETFQLTMALRRLTSQSIERRVNGVQYISFVCQNVRKGYISHSFKFTTVEFLSKWIEETKLLQLLFGPNSHPQLMKQATDILRFMCIENVLTMDHLSVIWSALERAAQKLDDVDNELQTICKIIDDIASHLNVDHFEFLFSKFEKLSAKELTEHHLQLMKDLMRNMYMKTITNESAERIANVLWNLVQDETCANEKLETQAQNLLKEVLSAYCSKEFRLKILVKCVDNLSEHKSVVSSLHVLERVIDIYPLSTEVGEQPDRWGVVQYLDKEFSMMKKFFEDIKYFKEQATAKAKAIRDSREQKEMDEEYFSIINQMKDSKCIYLEEIKQRLEFLDLLLNKSNIRLKKDHIDIIWDIMVVNCLTPQEREEVFKWFQKVMDGFEYKSLEDGIPEHLFVNKFLRDILPEWLSLPAYESFEKFFLFVNQSKGNIQMVENGKAFFVANYNELIGVDYLWQIILHAREEGVCQKAIVFLNMICNRLNSDLKQQIAVIRKSTLDRSMKELAQATASYKTNPKIETRDRCLRVLNLIHQFLNITESRGLGKYRPHNALSRGKKLQLTIFDRVTFRGYSKPPQFTLTIYENDTLWDLRYAIATKLNRLPEVVQLFSRIKLDDTKNSYTIASLGIRDRSNVHASLSDEESKRVPLVTSTNPPQLVERTKAALEYIFKLYAKNPDGTMSLNDMRDYIIACGAGESSASKTRIQTIFSTHGSMEDKLDVNGFFDFYRLAAVERPEHVWNDLVVFKFRYDLKSAEEVKKEEEMLDCDQEALPRYILAHESKVTH